MTRKDQWDRDIQIEKVAADFLDANFYPLFKKSRDVVRYSDTYHQFGGVDVSIGKTNFDEKCNIYGCINRVLQHIGLECSILNKAGNVSEGWFMNSKLSTDYYSFISLSATTDDARCLSSCSQVTAADVLWVSKHELSGYVERFTGMTNVSLDARKLRFDSDYIEEDPYGCYASLPDVLGFGKPKDGKYRNRYNHGRFWLTYSSRMHERPVNLVVARQALESLPHSTHFIVTKERVRRIDGKEETISDK